MSGQTTRTGAHARTIVGGVIHLCAVALLILGAGCEPGPHVTDADLQVLDTAGLRELRETAPESLVLVDVRSPEAYQQGHIPGALNVPMPELRRDDPRLREAGYVAVYGRDWQTALAAAAAKKLIALGYANVYEYRGGLRAWRAEGGAVVEESGEESGG